MDDMKRLLELFAKLDPLFKKVLPLLEYLANLWKGRTPRGKHGPGAGTGLPGDEDVPNPTVAHRRPTEVLIAVMRVVLNAQRFPNGPEQLDNPRQYDGGIDAIPYNSKVTFDTELHDKDGGIPVQADSPLAHTTVFYCQFDGDPTPARVGPGTDEHNAVSSDSVGAGGHNYTHNSKGMIATFRLAREGTYKAWAQNGDAKSRVITLRTS